MAHRKTFTSRRPRLTDHTGRHFKPGTTASSLVVTDEALS
jgi:hypothetical protein